MLCGNLSSPRLLMSHALGASLSSSLLCCPLPPRRACCCWSSSRPRELGAYLSSSLLHCSLQGALLLVLFQTSHTLEHLLTHRAQGNLAELYDTIPTSAVLVQVGGPGGAPELGSARQVVAGEVAVGNHMLVKPGEQVGYKLRSSLPEMAVLLCWAHRYSAVSALFWCSWRLGAC